MLGVAFMRGSTVAIRNNKIQSHIHATTHLALFASGHNVFQRFIFRSQRFPTIHLQVATFSNDSSSGRNVFQRFIFRSQRFPTIHLQVTTFSNDSSSGHNVS